MTPADQFKLWLIEAIQGSAAAGFGAWNLSRWKDTQQLTVRLYQQNKGHKYPLLNGTEWKITFQKPNVKKKVENDENNL